jgi:TRAP transporter TAXI family solute receptor
MHSSSIGGVTRILSSRRVVLGLPAVVLTVALALAGPGAAQSLRDMSILSGAMSGTYYQFSLDISTLVKTRCGKSITVRESTGSLDNLRRLRSEQATQLAIVQQDVLDYLRMSERGDARIKDWIAKFKYVHALYPEEVHIVVRRDSGLRTLADLAGKRIVTGQPGSGTSLTATFVLAGLSKFTEIQLSPREGILRLLDLVGGERVDAVFYVAGKPVPLLTGKDALITERHLRMLSFVRILKQEVPSWYDAAELAPSIYPWLERTVDTVSVRSVLIAYDFQKEQCANIAMIARLIKDNLDDLERFGHEKWRDVSLNAEVPGWARYGCVAQGLVAHRDGCRFVNWTGDEDDQPLSTPAADCSEQCKPSGNPLVCMLCKDKQKLKGRP